MKKLKTLFTALLVAASLTAFAQDDEDILKPKLQVRVNPLVAYDYQFRYHTDDEVSSAFMGVTAGAQAYANLGRLFVLRAGLAYKYSFSNRTVAYYNLQKGDASISEHSVELPITFAVKFPVGKTYMHIDIGPTGSFVFASTMTARNNVLRYVEGTRYNLFDDDNAQRWNLFACGNVGFEITPKLILSAGYRYGFFNVRNEDEPVDIHCINARLIINL